jgi:hypothetical protein
MTDTVQKPKGFTLPPWAFLVGAFAILITVGIVVS